MHKLPITVLVQTKNEEFGIGECLESLSDFSEVIVVDSDSTDKTKEIAASFGAKVVNFTWNGQYPKKKQWQLDNLKVENEWVLFLDADEKPTPDLILELTQFFKCGDAEKYVAGEFTFAYFFLGRRLKYGHRVRKIAMMKKGYVHFPEFDDLDAPGMGELEGHYQPKVDGKKLRFLERILHEDLDPISSWFARHNRYSDWEAYLWQQGQILPQIGSSKSLQGRIFQFVPFKPWAFFIYSYVLRMGFLDGRAGLDYAIANSFYYWQIAAKKRDLTRIPR